jgi:hypothetical protein
MYCVEFSLSTTIFPLNTFHLLVFLEEVECAVCTVGTQSFNFFKMKFRLIQETYIADSF